MFILLYTFTCQKARKHNWVNFVKMVEHHIQTKNTCSLYWDARLWEEPVPLNKFSKSLLREHLGDGMTLGKEVSSWNSGFVSTLKKALKPGVLSWVTFQSGGEGRQEDMDEAGLGQSGCVGDMLSKYHPLYVLFLNWRYFNSQGCPHMGIFHSMSLWCSHKYCTFPASTCSMTSSFTGGNKV